MEWLDHVLNLADILIDNVLSNVISCTTMRTKIRCKCKDSAMKCF